MADKLKVGDRVKVLSTRNNSDCCRHEVGDVGTIEKIDSDGTYRIDVDGDMSWYLPAALKLHPLQGENG